jgi:class 3 adenylate cyclase
MDTPASAQPRHRSILAVDIEGSTSITSPARASVRHALYDLFERALLAGEIAEWYRDPFINLGDGILCLIHPVDQVPKTVLLTKVVPALAGLLALHAERRPELAFRLRVVVHAGEVHADDQGWYGEDIDVACRLLDAEELKRRLRRTPAPLVLVVSQRIHHWLVRPGYPGIDRESFSQDVHVRVGEQRLRGWVQVPEPRRSEEGISA